MLTEDVKDIRFAHKIISSNRRGSSTTKNKLFLLEMDKEEWKIIESECQELVKN